MSSTSQPARLLSIMAISSPVRRPASRKQDSRDIEVRPSYALIYPFFKLWLREVVIVDPPFVASVVRRINVDALDPSRVCRKKGLQGDEVVSFDNQVTV